MFRQVNRPYLIGRIFFFIDRTPSGSGGAFSNGFSDGFDIT